MTPPSPALIHVVLADDHHLVRSGIRSLLNGLPDVRVIAEAASGEELLAILEHVHPDVVVTDIAMPGIDGITAISTIRMHYPDLRIIVLSMHQGADMIKRAVAAGASAYLRKDASDSELATALRTVAAAGSYFSPPIMKALMEDTQPAIEDELTLRQIQILRLIADGRSSKEIGAALGLSPKTVDVHRARIMDRLDLHDVASLTLYAVRKGLLAP